MGIAGLLILTTFAAEPVKQPMAEDLQFFEKSIRPVLVEHCDKCHGRRSSGPTCGWIRERGFSKGGIAGRL